MKSLKEQMFASYISLGSGIVRSIHICRICSMRCSSSGMHKLFPWHISNSCRVLESPLEGKAYPEEVGTAFHLRYYKIHTGLGLMRWTQQMVRATKGNIVGMLSEYEDG